jgi:hypothetical protein
VSSNSILLNLTGLPGVRLETQMLSFQQMLEFATLPGLCCLKQHVRPCQLYTISQVPIIPSELTGQVYVQSQQFLGDNIQFPSGMVDSLMGTTETCPSANFPGSLRIHVVLVPAPQEENRVYEAWLS